MKKRDPKDRLARAIEQAAHSLSPRWKVSILKNDLFHIEAIRQKEVIRILVVLEEATEQEREAVITSKFPEIFTREIWVRHRGRKGFEIIEF